MAFLSVTIAAPRSGASDKFTTSGTATETDVTNASSVATATPADAAVIHQVSRMEAWKGHRLLLQALGRMRDEPGWVCWGVSVTFAAPGTCASGKFTTSGTATETDVRRSRWGPTLTNRLPEPPTSGHS